MASFIFATAAVFRLPADTVVLLLLVRLYDASPEVLLWPAWLRLCYFVTVVVLLLFAVKRIITCLEWFDSSCFATAARDFGSVLLQVRGRQQDLA